jgi:hypothetical protein
MTAALSAAWSPWAALPAEVTEAGALRDARVHPVRMTFAVGARRRRGAGFGVA